MGDVPEQLSDSEEYRKRIRSLAPALKVSEDISDAVYFIEDSNIDLGLLVSVERNLQRILEILTDYLDWYLDPERKKKDKAEEKEDSRLGEKADKSRGAASESAADGESDHEKDDVDGEDEESGFYGEGAKGSWVKKIDYLTYGYDETPEWLALQDTLSYLKAHSFDDSSLHRSRKTPSEFGDGFDYDPNQPGVHYCDFCGKPMNPGTYKVLKDGRERCKECSDTAVSKRSEFKKVYLETIQEMEKVFGIKIQKKIIVRMANARKVNDGFDNKFEPSPKPDMRVLGFASQKNGKHFVMVENGAPRLTMKQTLVHELTHIWQHENWEPKERNTDEQIIVEGMAVWAEVQYLVCIGEEDAAKRYMIARSRDKTSPYGVGMTKYLKKYKIQEKKEINTARTPFKSKYPPVK
jgi:hypothetical protein